MRYAKAFLFQIEQVALLNEYYVVLVINLTQFRLVLLSLTPPPKNKTMRKLSFYCEVICTINGCANYTHPLTLCQ